MKTNEVKRSKLMTQIGLGMLICTMLAMLTSCASSSRVDANETLLEVVPVQENANVVEVPAQNEEEPVLQLLSVKPDRGYVGDTFTITGEGLPPNTELEWVWVTVDGFYETNPTAENIEFYGKSFNEKWLVLGQSRTDAQGQVTANLTVPEDYGEVHDIFARVGDQQLGKGGYRILRQVTVTPTEGPLGTPVTIQVTGLGWKTYESTIAVRYDNSFVGIMTAVTTRGTAQATIRASGSVGQHVIDINHGAKSVPYLNNQQSGTAHIPDFRFWFTVTKDAGPPPAVFDWPDKERIATTAEVTGMTTSSQIDPAAGVTAVLAPESGPIDTMTELRASGLLPELPVTIFWVTARGNRVGPRGWHLEDILLDEVTANSLGELQTELTIPDDLGGWHMVKLVQNEQVLLEIPYFLTHSLVGITPSQVKAGEEFTIQIKGVGWTELNNGVAVTYDNDYIGFACGFNSNGDVTMHFIATGEPGTHLIDIYPMIYQGHGKPPWGYQTPILTYRDDFPGLALGYNLPTIRLAIEVIE